MICVSYDSFLLGRTEEISWKRGRGGKVQLTPAALVLVAMCKLDMSVFEGEFVFREFLQTDL
jgi:hypothetical protein